MRVDIISRCLECDKEKLIATDYEGDVAFIVNRTFQVLCVSTFMHPGQKITTQMFNLTCRQCDNEINFITRTKEN